MLKDLRDTLLFAVAAFGCFFCAIVVAVFVFLDWCVETVKARLEAAEKDNARCKPKPDEASKPAPPPAPPAHRD